MSLMTILEELDRQAISLSIEGEALKVSAPKGALTAELREALGRYKAQLLAWLRESAEPADDTLPACVPDPAAWDRPFPLSDLQRGFYLAEDPFMEFHVRPHYYIEKDVEVLDVARYEAAWNKALHRHRGEIAVVRPDGDLRCVPDPEPLRCRVLDLTGLPTDAVQQELLAVRESMMRAELPLDRWPWLDLRVSRWRDDAGAPHSRIHYNHNNFFADGGGTTRLLAEVERYYRDPGLTLPPLRLGLRDALLTLDELAASAAGQADRRYWEDRLAHLPGPPQLPLRAGLNRRCRSRLSRRERFMDAPRWAAFKAHAADHGLTPSGAVFAAYAEVLAAWSNQRHFVLSNMVTRRLGIHEEIFDILGNFASLYPLEVDLRADDTFAERARRLSQQVNRDTRHLRWGGMQVMQALNQRQGGFGTAPIPFVVGSGLFMKGFTRSDFSCLETSQVMLDHQFWELPDGRYYYVWDLLEEAFPDRLIDDMGEAYHGLIHRLADSAEAWHSRLFDLVPAAHLHERQAVCPSPRPVSPHRLEQLAQAVPGDRTALWSPSNPMSYERLRRDSDAVAAMLQQAGLCAGDAVAIMLERGPQLLAAVHGILKAGGVYVPVDPSLPAERRDYLIGNSGAGMVLTAPAPAAAGGWPVGVRALSVDAALSAACARYTANADNTQLAYILYTSGSTGRPKGVMIDHRGAVNTVLEINDRFRVGPRDRVFGVSSFGFDLSVYDIFGAAAAGAALVYPDPGQTLDPAHWLERLIDAGVSVWNSAPPLASLLVEAAERRAAQLPQLRLILLSGDWIAPSLPDRLRRIAPNATVVSLGGATEASIWSIVYEIGEVDPSAASIPYGYPLRNQSWQVLDAWGRPAPRWSAGELYIGGVGLAQGYWQDAEKTAAAFITHPATGERLYRTGDLGRYLPGGVIEFLGRRDHQVKIQGHRIELGEIETVLAAHPAVDAAVVTVHTPAGGGAQLVAHVVPAGTVPSVDELQAHLARKLPDYMVPRRIACIDRLPLSANGKVDRKALPPVDEAPKAVRSMRREPADAVERTLVAIWQEVLGVDDAGPDDDFFDLGGQSFEAVRVIGRIREAFDRALSLGDIWQARTPARLARQLRDGDSGAPTPCLVTIDTRGQGTPLFLIHPAGGHVLCYRELGACLPRPVFAFQAPGVDGHTPVVASIPELARRYLRELEAAHPQGPVRLGGWSSGGPIAYEMAVQLTAAGRVVEGVAVLDSPAPLVHEPVGETTMLDWFLGDLDLPAAVVDALRQAGLHNAPEDTRLNRVAAILHAHGVGLGADLPQLAAIYRVFRGIVRASRAYRAPPARVPLLILRARRGVVDEFAGHPHGERPDWGWQTLVRGRLATASVDATHYTLLSPPVIGEVAEILEHGLPAPAGIAFH